MLCKEWFTRLKTSGAIIPSKTTLAQGPMLLQVKEVDQNGNAIYDTNFSGKHNIAFLAVLHNLMPSIAGMNVWKGSMRCARSTEFTNSMKKVGTLQEMVTTSDMAFLCWTIENYYDGVKSQVERMMVTDCDNPSPVEKLSEKSRWGANATKKFGGWTEEGKLRWNYIRGTLRHTWDCVVRENENGKDKFTKEFEKIWNEKYSRSRLGGSGQMDNEDDLVADDDFDMNVAAIVGGASTTNGGRGGELDWERVGETAET